MTLTFDLLILEVVAESRVTWTSSVPLLVFLGLSVLDLGPVYGTQVRETSDEHHRLMPLPGAVYKIYSDLLTYLLTYPRGRGITSCAACSGAATIMPRPRMW